jgi:RNA polymerase sigma-70 factor, ECF subfamily
MTESMKVRGDAGDSPPEMQARAVAVPPRGSSSAAQRALTRAIPEELTIESVFRNYVDDVHRIVARLLGPSAGRADVEDVVQLVFIAIQRALPRFRGDSKLSTWVYGVSARVVMTQLRGWRRHRRLLAALGDHLQAADTYTPEQSASERQELARVWRCLLRIKPKKRVVYIMHELEDLSGNEIAEALEIPVATVWTRLHHARKELLAALAREQGGTP